MKKVFDISNFVDTITESKILFDLTNRLKQRRKELKLSQIKLSKMSGVSYASIRRFEKTGEISLTSLVKIAHAIDCLEDFNYIFQNKKITNLKDY